MVISKCIAITWSQNCFFLFWCEPFFLTGKPVSLGSQRLCEGVSHEVKSKKNNCIVEQKSYIYIYNGNWIDQARARSYKTWFDRPVVQLCCQNFEIVSRNKTQESHLSPPQCFSHVPETCFRVGFFWCFESLFIANNSTSWTQKFDHTIMNLWINKSMRKFVNKSMNEYSSTQIQENTCFIACPRTAIAANRRTWILV